MLNQTLDPLDLADDDLDESRFVDQLIRAVVDRFPKRQAGTLVERQAQEYVAEVFSRLGLVHHFEEFTTSTNLYATMALNFGVGSLGSLVSGIAPALAAGLHMLSGTSYFLDSTRRAYLLRRLQRQYTSQNLLFTLSANRPTGPEGAPGLRIVVMAHIDAAFTGWIFSPKVVTAVKPGGLPSFLSFMERPLAVTTGTQFALAGLNLLRAVTGPIGWPLRPLNAVLGLPALIAFVTNLQIVLKNEIVPGACDDLSGVAGLALLARRIAAGQPDDVEFVFVVTGSEEAGTCGAYNLADTKSAVWDRKTTVILGLDGLCNGDLRWIHEGEMVKRPVPAWLESLLERVAASEAGFAQVSGFQLPVGATDVYPFRQVGYDGVCLSCVDPDLHAPRHYHLPSDVPDNLDCDQIVRTVDFAESLVRTIVAHKHSEFAV